METSMLRFLIKNIHYHKHFFIYQYLIVLYYQNLQFLFNFPYILNLMALYLYEINYIILNVVIHLKFIIKYSKASHP